jgi:hypothetical protein
MVPCLPQHGYFELFGDLVLANGSGEGWGISSVMFLSYRQPMRLPLRFMW